MTVDTNKEKNKESEYEKAHLQRVGDRIKQIRLDLSHSISSFEKEVNLPGAVMTRFETGKGIQILNLLKILNFLEEKDYNIKWLLSFNNDNEFIKNENNLSLLTFDKQSIIDLENNLTFNKQSIIDLANNVSTAAAQIKSKLEN